MSKFREFSTVILCECGPVGDGIARLARIASICNGIAWVDNRQFPVDTPEPWDIPQDRTSPIRYLLKLDTPDNRRFHGISDHVDLPAVALTPDRSEAGV
jgi:hypothetical protein